MSAGTLGTAMFGLAAFLYLGSAVMYGRLLSTHRSRLGRWASAPLMAGWALQTLLLLARWVEAGRPPVSNLFEFIAFSTWLMVLVFLIIDRTFGQRALGAFVVPLVVILMAMAFFLPRDIAPLRPILESPWLPIHAGFSIVAYAFFSMSFAASIVFLLQEAQLKAHRRHNLYDLLPPLETTEGLAYRMVELGFPFLVLTIVSGAFWSQIAWGSYWSWEPKQTASLITLLVYAVYFHARVTAGWRGRRGAWLMVAGFAAVLVTFLGITLLAPGLHDFVA